MARVLWLTGGRLQATPRVTAAELRELLMPAYRLLCRAGSQMERAAYAFSSCPEAGRPFMARRTAELIAEHVDFRLRLCWEMMPVLERVKELAALAPERLELAERSLEVVLGSLVELEELAHRFDAQAAPAAADRAVDQVIAMAAIMERMIMYYAWYLESVCGQPGSKDYEFVVRQVNALWTLMHDDRGR